MIERSKTKTFHCLRLTLNGFSCKYRQSVMGVEHKAHVKGGAGKNSLSPCPALHTYFAPAFARLKKAKN